MSKFRRLSESVMASPQLALPDIDLAHAQGVTLIICNRPDDEESGQLGGDLIREAAAKKGIEYRSIPISGGNFKEPEVAAMVDALESATGQVLAFCRSGTRSTLLWALAEASIGEDPDVLAQQAEAAGYDVSPVRPVMDMLAAKLR
jgi:uncharacterized protein (TIGR01244 family)